LGTANPDLKNPATEAGAVVLIDEIDLHLHPTWQREIVHKLTETFPRCQFIATTHSPQVIGEVEHDHIQILAEDGVFSPPHSFGVDASRVLEEIMEAEPRNREVRDLLSRASKLIDRERFKEARELLGKLNERLGSNDPDVAGLGTLLDFVEGED
jgi:predicted ATP-binding protein involved in virulence